MSWAQGGVDMAELCRKSGVSRPTGYAWVKRFRAADHDVRAVDLPWFHPANLREQLWLDR